MSGQTFEKPPNDFGVKPFKLLPFSKVMRRKKPLCIKLNMIRLVLNYFDIGPNTDMPLTETTPDDIELEKRAKESPEAQFYLHVGPSALSKVKAKSTTMDLNDVEMDAARGMHLAIALDAYTE